jgi:hypothetical protein
VISIPSILLTKGGVENPSNYYIGRPGAEKNGVEVENASDVAEDRFEQS